MASRPITYWNQNVPPSLHTLDLSFKNSQLGRIDLIVRRVDGHKRRSYAFELRGRIIIARGVKRIEHVVGVSARELPAHKIIEHAISRLPCRRLLLPLKGAARHKQ